MEALAEKRKARLETEDEDGEDDSFRRLLSKIRRRGGPRAVDAYLETRARYREAGLPASEAPLPPGTASPTSAEFLAYAQQGYSGGLDADVDCFVELPHFVCEAIEEQCKGLVNTRGRGAGRPRYHLTVLSYMAGLMKERLKMLDSDEASTEIEYEHGAAADLDDWELVVSMEKVARAILERFHFRPVEQGDTSRAFKSFARKIQRVFEDLDGMKIGGRIVMKRLGPAVETGDRKSDCFGQRFTLAGSVLWDLLPNLRYSPAPRILTRDELAARISASGSGEVTLAELEAAERDLTANPSSSPCEGDGDKYPLGDDEKSDAGGDVGRVFRTNERLRGGLTDGGNDVLVDVETGEILGGTRSGKRHDDTPAPSTEVAADDAAPQSHLSPARGDVNKHLATVDVAALYDRLVPAREDVTEGFTRQATKTAGLEKRGDLMTAPEREVEGLPWQQNAARTSTTLAEKAEVEGHLAAGREQYDARTWAALERKEKLRHVTVGAFREGHATSGGEGDSDRKRRPCAVPFVVFEIDTPGKEPRPEVCYLAARRLGRRLVELGVAPEDLLGSFSGNESIHLRVPSGAFTRSGEPLVFRTPDDAKAVIERLYDLVLRGAVLPRGAQIDRGLANPTANIRAVGSVHEKRYQRTYKRVIEYVKRVQGSAGFPRSEHVEGLPVPARREALEALPLPEKARRVLLEDFDGTGHGRVLHPHRIARMAAERRYCVSFYFDEMPALPALQAWSEHYRGLTLKAPHRAAYAEGLAGLFHQAVRSVETARRQRTERGEGEHENNGIVERILEGVAPGEEFFPGHVGRNKAAYLLSRYALDTQGSRETARQLVERWNAEQEVPLGEGAGDDPGELDYIFRRVARSFAYA